MLSGLFFVCVSVSLSHCFSLRDESRYSSFQCTGGGNQKFPPNWQFYEESFNQIENRVCMFKNICHDKTHLKYYRHPEERNAPDFAQIDTTNLLLMGMFDDVEAHRKLNVPVDRVMEIVDSAIPAEIPFIDNKTWTLTKASYAHNFAHLLLDDLFPALAGLELFNIDVSDGRPAYYGCEPYTIDNGRVTTTFDGVTPLAVACHENFKKYSTLVFGTPAVALSKLEGYSLCYERMIIGHGGAFNNRFMLKQRGVTLRKGRDVIINNLNLQHLPPPTALSIAILTKPTVWPTMCADIESMLATSLHMENIPVICIVPGEYSTEAEIEMLQSATLILSIHGTVSLLALFAKDGAVLISIGNDKENFKEGQTLPYATHIKTFYTKEEDKKSLPSLIRYGLFTAASNFDIPFNYEVAKDEASAEVEEFEL